MEARAAPVVVVPGVQDLGGPIEAETVLPDPPGPAVEVGDEPDQEGGGREGAGELAVRVPEVPQVAGDQDVPAGEEASELHRPGGVAAGETYRRVLGIGTRASGQGIDLEP